jgi:hypothetical protein
MAANPSINDLQESDKYELIAELKHEQIKEFVVNQLAHGGWLVKSYMVYQIIMLVLGAFVITRAVIVAFQQNILPLYYLLAALFFCFSLLIVVHELLHGGAMKMCGAPKVNYGAYFKKFIFYAEADQCVFNRSQFALIALCPFVVIKVLTLVGIVFLFQHPAVYFFAIIMSAHSFFCAGDIGMLSVFHNYGKGPIYTYDVSKEKRSFYFREL